MSRALLSDTQPPGVHGPDERLIVLFPGRRRGEFRSLGYGDERHARPKGRRLSEAEQRFLIEAAVDRYRLLAELRTWADSLAAKSEDGYHLANELRRIINDSDEIES